MTYRNKIKLAIILFVLIVSISMTIIIKGKVPSSQKVKPQENNVLEIDNYNSSNRPFSEIFSEENIKKYEKEIEKRRYVHKPEKIMPEPIKKNRSGMTRPEDKGESFIGYSAEKLLNKLKNGGKIEQRKAAIELWSKYGTEQKKLTEKQKKLLNKEVFRYLRGIKEDFTQNFRQLKILWTLGSDVLLHNVINENRGISENASRLLSLMKKSTIIDQLIKQACNAKEEKDIKKYIFALKYMKINNPIFIKRPIINKKEAEKIYKSKIIPVIKKLKKMIK